MTIAYFLTYEGPAGNGEAFRKWYAGQPLSTIKSLPGLRAIDWFEPNSEGSSSDPYLDDGDGPVLIVQADFDSVAEAEAAASDNGFESLCKKMEGCPASGIQLHHEMLEVEFYPVEGETEASPRTASLSYVVRYERPVEDEAAFISNYTKMHPPLLGRFENIRNVICYTPVDWNDPMAIKKSDYMLGNEVVFDSLNALNASLKSDLRHELREDFKTFPPFTGRNTHFAMNRTRRFPEG
jgi:hypothetical protein